MGATYVEAAKAMGRRVSFERKKINISQEMLAKKIGASVKDVQRWERGKEFPSKPQANKMATLFHMDAEALLHDSSNVEITKINNEATKWYTVSGNDLVEKKEEPKKQEETIVVENIVEQMPEETPKRTHKFYQTKSKQPKGTFGFALHAYRMKNQIRQEEIADIIGVTTDYYKKWEQNRAMPSDECQKKLDELICEGFCAKYLGKKEEPKVTEVKVVDEKTASLERDIATMQARLNRKQEKPAVAEKPIKADEQGTERTTTPVKRMSYSQRCSRYDEIFVENVRRLCNKKGIELKRIEILCGMAEGWFSRDKWDRGEVRIYVAMKAASVLGTTIEELMTDPEKERKLRKIAALEAQIKELREGLSE